MKSKTALLYIFLPLAALLGFLAFYSDIAWLFYPICGLGTLAYLVAIVVLLFAQPAYSMLFLVMGGIIGIVLYELFPFHPLSDVLLLGGTVSVVLVVFIFLYVVSHLKFGH